MKRWPVILILLCCLGALGAEVIPPSPPQYFNDFANVTSSATANQLNQSLEDFEKQTSSQIVVAIYPKMQSDSSIEDYAVRVFRSWKVGQKDKNNGAVLLVFVQDHKMNITTGYGLEGALPDALCKQIISEQIAPHFKQNDYNGGLTAGVTVMIAAAKGEYHGIGRTVAQAQQQSGDTFGSLIGLGFVLFIFLVIIIAAVKNNGRRRYGGGWWLGGGGWGGGGGWSGGGGGGWSGGGGGGFSGGGGSSGGGGASGSW